MEIARIAQEAKQETHKSVESHIQMILKNFANNSAIVPPTRYFVNSLARIVELIQPS